LKRAASGAPVVRRKDIVAALDRSAIAWPLWVPSNS
jgi:hypothetical protein